jgi:predicted membrane-bound mannosyltransferase
MAAHVLEHLAFAYRQEIEKSMGVALPETDEKLPPGVEAQLSQLVAQAAQKVLQGNQAEAAQQQAQETQQDPLFQLEMAKLALQGKKLEGQQHQAASKSLMDIMNLMARDENDKARIVADLLKSDKQLTTQKASQAAKLVTDISKTIATQEKGRFGDR